MDAVTAGDHWLRCRHRLRLKLPLPLSLIPICSLRSQWICNNRTGWVIWDGGRQDFKSAERSGSVGNTGCGAGSNMRRWVWLWGSCGCWCATTASTQRGGWSMYRLSLCGGRGSRHLLSDIRNVRIVQRSWVGGVLNFDWRGYKTTSLRGNPSACRERTASLSRGKWRIPRTPTLWLIMTIDKTLNISYYWSRVRVRSVGRHSPILMLDVKNAGKFSSACSCNGRQGRLQFEWPGRDSTQKGGTV